MLVKGATGDMSVLLSPTSCLMTLNTFNWKKITCISMIKKITLITSLPDIVIWDLLLTGSAYFLWGATGRLYWRLTFIYLAPFKYTDHPPSYRDSHYNAKTVLWLETLHCYWNCVSPHSTSSVNAFSSHNRLHGVQCCVMRLPRWYRNIIV